MSKESTSKTEEQLQVGGVNALKLAANYGTPLIAYDVGAIKQQIQSFREAFIRAGIKYRIVYASKAFSSLAMYRLLANEGVGCDVVSGGELYAALRGGISPTMIEFHGNNKTPAELAEAISQGIGCIVVDNFYEIELLEKICEAQQRTVKVSLRVAPGIEAETHQYIATGQSNSKFGFDLDSGQADQALKQLLHSKYLQVIGVHCHIGSQIFAIAGFQMAAAKMIDVLQRWQEKYAFEAQILNLGGGFGIKYTTADQPLKPAEFVSAIITTVQQEAQKKHLQLPEIWIEPGRSLVGEAGTTLYTVGSTKTVPGICNFVAVDGGMGDNIRPALYGAQYSAYLAKNLQEKATQVATIVGKYCESGDVLVKQQKLPAVQAGDVLAITSTGAYGYSMASNYNRNGRPPVVFCESGHDKLVLKRETYADMLSLEVD
ncbi:MAG TPA: diaminopimelate decarboxylase [Candidatus Ligilactobacillus excrementipullorum]|nr:diaminopimelate decarboxylase [Candidatus Ligilactobacillus excrementipullorum]